MYESKEYYTKETLQRLHVSFQDAILLAMQEEAVPKYMQEDIYNDINDMFNEIFDNE